MGGYLHRRMEMDGIEVVISKAPDDDDYTPGRIFVGIYTGDACERGVHHNPDDTPAICVSVNDHDVYDGIRDGEVDDGSAAA